MSRGFGAIKRGAATGVLENIASLFDKTVQAADKKLKGQAWTDAGREFALDAARAEAEGMLRVIADSATQRHRDHLAQLETEMQQVPEINEFRAVEIRKLLRNMETRERELFISRSCDPEVLAAVVHGPRSFPLTTDDAVTVGLTSYNRAHRPQQTALAEDARSFISAVEGFSDTVARELRRSLR
ncbi:MAG: hypothetical protein M3541_11700 [Acidobacteriota bacterium]|nr:hypothetical protein [Acidobacteriota bacterium]MDQ3419424.1 hypothetical protein [Acidobacteriota bacterium]